MCIVGHEKAETPHVYENEINAHLPTALGCPSAFDDKSERIGSPDSGPNIPPSRRLNELEAELKHAFGLQASSYFVELLNDSRCRR